MSRLWRNTARLVITRSCVVLLRGSPGARNESSPNVLQWDAGASKNWNACADAVRLLQKEFRRGESASIVLADRICRFAIVDLPPGLRAEEVSPYIGSRLRHLMGLEMDAWLFVAEKVRDSRRFVCSAPRALVEPLLSALGEIKVHVVSLRPHFTTKWNRLARSWLLGQGGWLAVREGEHATLGLIHEGRWEHLASRRCGSSLESLIAVIDRERHLLAARLTAEKRVFLAGNLCDFNGSAHGYEIASDPSAANYEQDYGDCSGMAA